MTQISIQRKTLKNLCPLAVSKKSVIRTANQDDITFLGGNNIQCIVEFTEKVFVFRKKIKKINSTNRKFSQLQHTNKNTKHHKYRDVYNYIHLFEKKFVIHSMHKSSG